MSLLLTPPHKSPSAPLARWGIFRDETGGPLLTKYSPAPRPDPHRFGLAVRDIADADARSRASAPGTPTRRPDSWSRQTGWGPRRFPPRGPGARRLRSSLGGGAGWCRPASWRPNWRCARPGESRTGHDSPRTSAAPLAGGGSTRSTGRAPAPSTPPPTPLRRPRRSRRTRPTRGIPRPRRERPSSGGSPSTCATPRVWRAAPGAPPGLGPTGVPRVLESWACPYACRYPTRRPPKSPGASTIPVAYQAVPQP